MDANETAARRALPGEINYDIRMVEVSGQLKRRLYVVAGTAAAGIGVIGIVVPFLPTTPFLLLAAACYARGSRRFYNALLCNRFIGSYVKNYLEGRGLSLKTKVRALSLMWVAMLCTAVWLTDSFIIRTILAIVLVGVTIHILAVKPAKKGMDSSD